MVESGTAGALLQSHHLEVEAKESGIPACVGYRRTSMGQTWGLTRTPSKCDTITSPETTSLTLT